jgi:hypothetical protein
MQSDLSSDIIVLAPPSIFRFPDPTLRSMENLYTNPSTVINEMENEHPRHHERSDVENLDFMISIGKNMESTQ